ncbi:MAG: pyrroloquinoline-quinone synthase PqqC [Azospirillum sp.]|nr:pyrroloquinoline-quinone synthase PqqC [Azospirillum sp.]
MTAGPMTAGQLEAALRQLGAARYHHHHPFHKRLHSGALDQGQVQAWALNRYYYQSRIPIKDAVVLSRSDDPAFRREWRHRLEDHDGLHEGDGGIARWLVLAEGVGLDRDYVASCRGVLPAIRFAVDAYIQFVRERSLLEAVASSLTELFSPTIISERVAGMIANYPFVTRETLAYFNARLTQAPRDSTFALRYVVTHADTPERQQAALGALAFKCDLLWAQLDALYHAYVEPRQVAPGGFLPGDPDAGGRAWANAS